MKVIDPVELFQKLCSSGAMQKGRLLGLDVGQRYVGLAVSDAANRIASPGSVLVRKKTNIDIMAKVFQKLVSQHSLVGFVVGYPFCLWGQSSVEAVQVRLFMEDLRNTGRLNGLTYTYWDENYTSKVGSEMPSANGDVAGKIFYANDWLLSVCGSPVRATGSKSSEIKNNEGQICCCRNTPGISGQHEQEIEIRKLG